MERINCFPLIIFDVCHNEASVKIFKSMVDIYYSYPFRKRYIISILQRKEYDKILKLLSLDKEAAFGLTSGDNSKLYTSADELYKSMIKY